MKRLGLISLFVFTVLFATGFKQSTRIIQVNPDGSGEIFVRVLFDPDHIAEETSVFDPKKLQAKAGAYGSGVRYVAGKEVTGEKGWKGYLAKYSFYDISELQIQPASLPEEVDLKELGEDLLGWNFTFTKAESGISTLKIVPFGKEEIGGGDGWEEAGGDGDGREKAGDADDGWEKAGDDDDGWDEAGDDDDDDGGWADAKEPAAQSEDDLRQLQQQKGRRYVTYLRVKGAVTSTNPANLAAYQSKKHPNTITLNDEQWDLMWRNQEARSLMKMESRNLATIAGKPVPGYRTITRRVTVKFVPADAKAVPEETLKEETEK